MSVASTLASLSVDCLNMVADLLYGADIIRLWSSGDVILRNKLCSLKSICFDAFGTPTWSKSLMSSQTLLDDVCHYNAAVIDDDSFELKILGSLPRRLKSLSLNFQSESNLVLGDLKPYLPQLESLAVSAILTTPSSLPSTLRIIKLAKPPKSFQAFLYLVPLVETLEFNIGYTMIMHPLIWPPSLARLMLNLETTDSSILSLPQTLTSCTLSVNLDSFITGSPIIYDKCCVDPLLRPRSLTYFSASLGHFLPPPNLAPFPPLLRSLEMDFLATPRSAIFREPLTELAFFKAALPQLETLRIANSGELITEIPAELTHDNYPVFPNNWAELTVSPLLAAPDALVGLPQGLKSLKLYSRSLPLLAGVTLPPSITRFEILADWSSEAQELSCALPSSLKQLLCKKDAVFIKTGQYLLHQAPRLSKLACGLSSLPSTKGLLALPSLLRHLCLTGPLDDFLLDQLFSSSLLPPILVTLKIDAKHSSKRLIDWIHAISPQIPLQKLHVNISQFTSPDHPRLRHRLPTLKTLWYYKELNPKMYYEP